MAPFGAIAVFRLHMLAPFGHVHVMSLHASSERDSSYAVSIRTNTATDSHLKTASCSHAKPSTDSHGKTATMLSLLLLEMLTTHACENERFCFASLELTALACGNNRPEAVI